MLIAESSVAPAGLNLGAGGNEPIDRLAGLFPADGEVIDAIEAIGRGLRSAVRRNSENSAVHSGLPEHELAALLHIAEVSEHGMDFATYARFLTEVVAKHSTNMASPRCLGHMTGIPPPFVHAVADLAVRLNQNLVKVDASRVLTSIERQVLAMLHRLVFRGQDDVNINCSPKQAGALGVLASGGTLANLTALWCARNACFAAQGDFRGVEEEGMVSALRRHDYEAAVIVGSELMHYSLHKSAGILGFGGASVIEIPVDADQRVNIDAAYRAIRESVNRRARVVALIGLAGSTDCGSIDPLGDLAEIARRERIHFHVDAAGGGGLLLSSRYRSRLSGIELADSITVDCHKQFCLPVGAAALLLKDPAHASVLHKHAPYMLHSDSEDLGKYTLEGSRPGTSLLIHAALSVIGRGSFGALVDRHLDIASRFAAMLSACEDFELLQEPQTNIVLYRYLPKRFRARLCNCTLSITDNRQLNAFNENLQRLQNTAGRTHVSRTTVKRVAMYPGTKIVALRAVINNLRIRVEDLGAVLEDQREIAARIESHGSQAHDHD